MNLVNRLHLKFLGFILTAMHLQAQNPISDFLHTSKVRYEQNSGSQITHFVLGNESADLDSIVSSISYAYLLNLGEASSLYVPLINIRREAIALRKDVLYLFQICGISVDDLLFLDDVSLKQNRFFLNLVDHNALNPKQEYLSEKVERIIDHHADENKYYPHIKEKWVNVVGSNATLVAEKFLSKQQVVPELATLLLAPILIDTSNLKSAEKTTSRDINTAKTLETIASSYLPKDFYQKLFTAKNDTADFTPEMLLSKDFKEYLDGDILYGISSLPATVEWSIDDLGQVAEQIQKYARERNLSYLILLMSSHVPQTKRKIVVYSPSMELLRAFDAYVRTDEVLKTILIPDSCSEPFQICFYRTEKAISRKKLQPLLHFSNLLSTLTLVDASVK